MIQLGAWNLHITRGVIDRITDAKLALGHSNATVNRTLELLRAILRKCVNDWEWLSRAPSVRMLKEPTRRIRFLSCEEAQQLLAALPEPLNAEAGALVSKQVGKHLSHVFSYRGRPIIQVSTKAWYAASERAGITDFRWHDLRRTWASWHVQNGTPLFALQELGGWASTEMVRRYAHLAADHLTPYAERLGALRTVASESDGTFTAQA